MNTLVDQLDQAGRPRWLVRLAAALSRRTRPTVNPRDLEPAASAQELLAWSQDDGRWNPRATNDWCSLLDDVETAWSRLGPKLKKVADIDTQLDALREVRAGGALAGDKRPSVEDAARALGTAFSNSGALPAAIDDLFEAAERSNRPASLDDETRWRLALLASVGEQHGHDWAVVADRFRRSLQWTGDAPLAESIRAVHKTLTAPAGRGHSIVWLAIDHAYAWGQPQDSAVQLFDGDWLLAALRDWSGPRDGVPPELAADPRRLPDACERLDADADPNTQLPVAFARIDLGEGPTAGARERARETLELLVARASTRQHGTTWKIGNPVLHFVDEDLVFEADGPIGDPDVYARIDRGRIIRDTTAEAITVEAQQLRAHIPVRDGRLHDALQLSKWLTAARDASPPARLVLSGRVIEQAANWADVGVPALIEDCLSWAWAVSKIGGDLANAGWHAVMRLPGGMGQSSTAEERDAFLETRRAIVNEASGEQIRLRTFEVLARLDWLAEQHAAETEIGDFLRELQQRVASGPSAADWIDELRDELRVRNARAVRTRNALVHGGPVISATAESVVGILDSLGSHALEWVMEGLAAERRLPELFAEHGRSYAGGVARLRAGGDPQVELSQLLKLLSA